MNLKRMYGYLALFAAFLIGNYGGYIGLWQDPERAPVKVYPYSVASLPPADQKLVDLGIYIDSEAELRKLLEDYLS